jgi:hypothetical protein
MITTFDYVMDRLFTRLDGLGDDEYRWEPVEGCWSLRQDPEGNWRIEGTIGNAASPTPAPFTTIAWRIGHIGVALGGFADRRFGEATLRVEDIDFPKTADAASGFLRDHHRAWLDGLATLDEQAWWKTLGPAWGPYADSNNVDLAMHVLDEVVHHGAEVALLRDLYARRRELR